MVLLSPHTTNCQGEDDLMQTIESNAKKRKIEVAACNWWEAVGGYSETKIFASAFPWLFPGGQGDIKDASEFPVDRGSRMLYKDARFIKDPVYTFFANSTSTHQEFQHLAGGFVIPFRQCTWESRGTQRFN
jgi:hypothetical protein